MPAFISLLLDYEKQGLPSVLRALETQSRESEAACFMAWQRLVSPQSGRQKVLADCKEKF